MFRADAVKRMLVPFASPRRAAHCCSLGWERWNRVSQVSKECCERSPCNKLPNRAFGAMKSEMRFLSVAIALVAVASCGRDTLDPAHAGKMWIMNPREQEQMVAALSNAHIPFEAHEVAGNGKEIWYDARLQDEVLRIRDELFGTPPPNGRNMQLRAEDAALFSEEMRKVGAAFRTGTFHGGQYVAWDSESDQPADAALTKLRISSQTLEEMKRIRELSDAEKTPRTNRSSRSREERAPAER